MYSFRNYPDFVWKPTPALYLRGEISGGPLDKDPPKGQIKLGNVGFGAMYIESISVMADNKPVPSITDVLLKETNRSYVVCSESTRLYKTMREPKPFQSRG